MKAQTYQPSYLHLLETGELKNRASTAINRLERCEICAVRCRVNRLAGQLGGCRTTRLARIGGYGPHMGEESPLTGYGGSGAIFFSGCNLRCQYCQNHEISQVSSGREMSAAELANIFLTLQDSGCHNLNLVSPSHVVPQILEALLIAGHEGLRLPLVYNTGGYDSLDTLRLLDGIIDIYMPDMKYSNPQIARRYSKIINYPAINQAAVREMHRQVGDLVLDEKGIARRGLLVRHLVLPNHVAGTKQIVDFLANEVSRHTYVNIMDQYYPAYQANLYPSLSRSIKPDEYLEALQLAHQAGLNRLATSHR